MQKKLWCQWVQLSSVTEEISIAKGLIISLYDKLYNFNTGKEINCEIGITIGKSAESDEYVVTVMKTKNNKLYNPKEKDNVKRFKDNNEYICFYFDTFDSAINFADCELPFHEEFQDRPVYFI